MMEIYSSYAEADEAYGRRFKQLLKPIAKDFGFTTWSKQDIIPGGVWQKEMASHLKKAMLFVPMISRDYLASDRCQAETTAALQLEQRGQLQIVCVLLRSTYMEGSPLENAQILPMRDKPIANWRNQDEAWIRVQRGILDAIKGMQIR
jgi:TIR domain